MKSWSLFVCVLWWAWHSLVEYLITSFAVCRWRVVYLAFSLQIHNSLLDSRRFDVEFLSVRLAVGNRGRRAYGGREGRRVRFHRRGQRERVASS